MLLLTSFLLISTAFAFSTTQYATVDPSLVEYLQRLLENEYELPSNVYEWNVTLIAAIIEGNDPRLLCGIDNSFYENLPEVVIERLPVWVWWCQRFYCLIPEDTLSSKYDTNYTTLGVNCTNYDVSEDINSSHSCPLPLIFNKNWSPFSSKCAIGCKYNGLLTGVSPQKLKSLRIVKVICCGIAMMFAVILIINQIADHKQEDMPFWKRGIVNHSSTFISLSWAFILCNFVIVEIVGLNQVLCADNGNNQRVVSYGNPHAGWTPCFLSGLAFYLSELCICNYSAVFALSLWQLFYKPLKHTWKSWFNINFDCLDVLCANSRRFSSEKKGATAANTLQCSKWKEKLHKKLSSSRACKHSCGHCCVGCMFAPSFKWHVCIWVINISLLAGSLHNNMYNAYHPAGVCFPTGNGNAKLLSIYDILPMIASTLFMTIFLPCAGTLLWQTTRTTASAGVARQMKQLGCRLSLFYFGIVFSRCCIISITLNAYFHNKAQIDASKTRIHCALKQGGDPTGCYDIGYVPSTAYPLLLFIGMPVAVLSATILSFHERNIHRWAKFFPFLRTCEFPDSTHEPKFLRTLPIANAHQLANKLSNPPVIELHAQHSMNGPTPPHSNTNKLEEQNHSFNAPTDHDHTYHDKTSEITITENGGSTQATETPPTQKSSANVSN